MIIPEEFQFKSDEHAREVMTAYIRKHFSGVLGAKANLLDQPNGLELIKDEVEGRLTAAGLAAPADNLRAA